MDGLRIGELAEATGKPIAILKNMITRGGMPKDEIQVTDGNHRRYSGYTVTALTIAEFLTAQGLNSEQACEVVDSHANVIKLYLGEVDADVSPTARFILSIRHAVFDTLTASFFWEPTVSYFHGTKQQTDRDVADAFNRVGTETKTIVFGDQERIKRVIAGPQIATVSVGEAYRVAKGRAGAAGYTLKGSTVTRANGYTVDGRAINKTSTDTGNED